MQQVEFKVRKWMMLSFILYFISFILAVPFHNMINIGLNGNNFSFTSLFLHNMYVSLKLFLFGMLTLGIGNSLYLFYNGFFLGLTFFSILTHLGLKPILTGLLPHALFEIPGFIIFSSLGYSSWFLISKIKKNALEDENKNFQPEALIKANLKSFILSFIVATFLLLIAAVIESNFSYTH